MKRRILSLAALLTIATASAAFAQAGGGTPPPPPQGGGMGGGMGGGGGRAAQRMAALLEGITLTPAQHTSIDSINAAYLASMPAFTPGQRPDSAQMAQRREMSMRRDLAIRTLLTSDQQKIWDHNIEVMRANMPQRP